MRYLFDSDLNSLRKQKSKFYRSRLNQLPVDDMVFWKSFFVIVISNTAASPY